MEYFFLFVVLISTIYIMFSGFSWDDKKLDDQTQEQQHKETDNEKQLEEKYLFKENQIDRKVLYRLYKKYKHKPWVLTKQEVLNNVRWNFILPPRWKGEPFWFENHIDFGLSSKIVIINSGRFIFLRKNDIDNNEWFDLYPYFYPRFHRRGRRVQFLDSNTIEVKFGHSSKFHTIKLSESEVNFIREFYEECELIQNEISKKIKIEELKQRSLVKEYQKEIISNFHENGDFNIEDTSNDFNTLLNKYQGRIIDVDRSLIQKFVKLSNYLNTKRDNIVKIYNSIETSRNKNQVDGINSMLFSEVSYYKLLLFHSLNMITSLVENDMVTFYEIYESYDELNIFNSNWENEVSEKLNRIDKQLKELNISIRVMERNIVDSLMKLNYTNKIGFRNLNHSVVRELKSINSYIDYNNLISSVSTYQLYQINKQVKGLK